MDKLKIYCMCLNNDYLNIVKKLNYIPVGLRNQNFSNEWMRDNTLDNIANKNIHGITVLLFKTLQILHQTIILPSAVAVAGPRPPRRRPLRPSRPAACRGCTSA